MTMSGMILYHGEPNGPSLIVLAALFETGLDVELRHIDLLAGERHRIPGLADRTALDMGVEGEGPVLVVDGEAMTDSVFIAQYLDELAGAGLQPKDPFAHWEMMMVCRRLIERGAPAAAFLGCMDHAHGELAALDQSGFDSRVAQIASPDLRQRWQDLRDGVFPDEQIADSRSKLNYSLSLAEDLFADGRDWQMKDFSILDLVAFGWHAGVGDTVPEALDSMPRTKAWLERVAARPSVQRALALATEAEPLRSWAPGPEINRWG
jgi:GSH-dependent disulfide-bond oxidoreductase